MTYTRTIRIANFNPAKYIIALVLLTLMIVALAISCSNISETLEQKEKEISEKEKEIFYLKDALKLKTSLAAKEDSSYNVWMNDHALRARVKYEIQKLKK